MWQETKLGWGRRAGRGVAVLGVAWAGLCAWTGPALADLESGGPWAGLMQGCDIIDGVEHCSFHVNGWKFYAYYEGDTPPGLLAVLERLPANLPLLLEGALGTIGDITAEITLSGVRLDPQGDAHARLREQLQGPWVSVDDPDAAFEVFGSELRWLHAGRYAGHEFLQIVPRCGELVSDDQPLLRMTEPEDHEMSRCYAVLHSDGRTLDLSYLPRGNTLRYRRPAMSER